MKRKAMNIIIVTSKFYLPFLHYCVCIYVHKNLKKPDTNLYIFLTLHKCKIFRAERAILCIKAWDIHAKLMLRETVFHISVK